MSAHLTFREHFLELKKRVVIILFTWALGFGAAYFFASDIYQFLVHPLLNASDESHRLIYTSLPEAFIVYVKMALYVGFFLASPIIFMQAWLFIAPGLYKGEKTFFLSLLFATPVLFILGAALAYYLIFPLAFKFFLSFEMGQVQGTLPIALEAKMSDYLSLVLHLIFAFGLCFELPLLLIILARTGLVTAQGLKNKRKYVFIIAFIVGAVLTPPDLISQISLAVPLYLLYEIALLFISRMQEKVDEKNKSA